MAIVKWTRIEQMEAMQIMVMVWADERPGSAAAFSGAIRVGTAPADGRLDHRAAAVAGDIPVRAEVLHQGNPAWWRKRVSD